MAYSAMLVILLLLSPLFLSVSCLKITPTTEMSYEDPELKCIANITYKYFREMKSLVYLEPNTATNKLLRILHSMEIISFNRGNSDVVNPCLAYMIIFENLRELLQRNLVLELVYEANWNPSARILAVFKYLREEELREVFDIFLHYRAYNVVVLNGTHTTELYTYNPFENFACGTYYSRIIYYGKCFDVTADIYPNKAITGLRNCFFRVSVPHWPPWGIDPSKVNAWPNAMGTEQYVFHLLSEIEKFKYKFIFDYDPEEFSTVSNNLSISGPMVRLVQNQTDFMLGGLMLIPSRAKVFSYISGHVDYIEEINIIVKRTGKAPVWKNFYLEFSAPVWVLLISTLFLYSAVVAIMLKTKDKGQVILVLMDSLLSHGARFRSRQSVKCVVIIWVIFAFLVNSFYTTNLMSLTTSPPKDYQIHDEATVIDLRLKPCISSVMGKYMESEQNHGEILKDAKFGTNGCISLVDSIKTVSKSYYRFTIVLSSKLYSFENLKFDNQQEKSAIYRFAKPYTKVIYAIYYNKGLPMKDRLYNLAIRIRETGLSDKNLRDIRYNQTLSNLNKHQDEENESGFVTKLVLPWCLYGTGVFVSAITFVVELASQYNKVQVSPVGK